MSSSRNGSSVASRAQSLSYRPVPHHPSAATLRGGTEEQDSSAVAQRIRAQFSSTISNTISELNRLQYEANQLARVQVKGLGVPGKKAAAPIATSDPNQNAEGSSSSSAKNISHYEQGANLGSSENVIDDLTINQVQPEPYSPLDGLAKTSSTHVALEKKQCVSTPRHNPNEIASSKVNVTGGLSRTPDQVSQVDLPSVQTPCVVQTTPSLPQKPEGEHKKRALKLVFSPEPNPRTSSAKKAAVPSAIPGEGVSPKDEIESMMLQGKATGPGSSGTYQKSARNFSDMFGVPSSTNSINLRGSDGKDFAKVNLKRTRHVDVFNKPDDFDVHDAVQHAGVARNWPTNRKRFAAIAACINTACIGLTLGIYAGEVPAIQYALADQHHHVILGNVALYLGLTVSTFVCWPLPLLHGRKPYVVLSLLLALVLQIPQGFAVGGYRDPNDLQYRCLLLIPRALSGLALGLSDMNSKSTLLDLYGASLQSQNEGQDSVDRYDVRRHGGGMGTWLGLWSWCTIGPISLGFMAGAFLISRDTTGVWGFWLTLFVLLCALLVSVVTPEVRRAAFRRTIAEFMGQGVGFSRVARGEVRMHLKAEGPYWWGEELGAGLQLSWKMMTQPGFFLLSVYLAWVYAQFTSIMMLLGALASKQYRYRPVVVGACAVSMTVGSLLAIPFQKASWFSRARFQPPRSDSTTVIRHMDLTSHIIRRTIFMAFLPVVAIAYTTSSMGPPFPIALPGVWAGLVGFFSTLALSECYGLIMETFDTSDLQPGMTGHPNRKSVAVRFASQRTNFSCYPRVSAGLAVTQALKYIFAAASTLVCRIVERREGVVKATVIVAGTLLLLTLLLSIVLVRWKTVQMIPGEEDRGSAASPTTDRRWEPVILGNPSGLNRRISVLEMGKWSRWSEIRRRNRIESQLTGGLR